MSDYAVRQETTRALCQQVARAVQAIAPDGLGHWDRIGEFVDPTDTALVLALSRWEIDPSDTMMQRVTDAYGDVLKAWREAVVEYTAEMTS